jgi:hypothetical protein
MPKDQVPQHFGLNDETVPPGYFAQLLYPFRRRDTKVVKAPLVP